MENETTAYQRGFRARLCGKAISANPYLFPSQNRADWLKGWIDQDSHLSDRDDVLDELFGS